MKFEQLLDKRASRRDGWTINGDQPVENTSSGYEQD